MYFKVPILRNIEKTGPWFHNGQVQTLDDAVRLMAQYEAGQHLRDGDVHSIVIFLHTLTGTIPQQYIQPPSPNAVANKAFRFSEAKPFHPHLDRSGGPVIMRRITWILGVAVVLVFLFAQLHRPDYNRAPVLASATFDSQVHPDAHIRSMLHQSCYNCHSAEGEDALVRACLAGVTALAGRCAAGTGTSRLLKLGQP